ncbi:molybdopterin molybdenumtransferase MoeA [Lysobacter pythonis]|uniref:Molybdopterin molybdenumtransferase n=1 Tax=Solilutibacter pythonis TaxID=2483112 RepID=A0A3M2HXK0_9GAMM|nr:gephyrin-like molybdotransferase Glp [Lysobacter pythonis]RMH93788.1 molybdopterin molybdenumtransferase MoeA [Lysobacter pythonis]
MMPVHQARALIEAHARALPGECVSIDDAPGRVLAEDVRATHALPPFDNSAMDGFGLRVAAGVVPAGTALPVSARLAAGDGATVLAPGSACEIMTGARVPAGCDSVVPVEQVDVLDRDADGVPRTIRLCADVAQGQHVRRAGEDVAAGAILAPAGAWVTPALAMLLRGAAAHRVPVARRPRAALLNTGRELVDDERPLREGEIRNTNGPYLEARLREAGAEVVLRETVGDETMAFVEALGRALAAGAEVIVSTGAVSMGHYDFIPDALVAMGARIHFHKLRMRPGKPLLFAQLPGGALCFGLPGNPVSSAVGLRFFVEPALRRMLGMPAERPLMLPLAAPVAGKPGFTRYHKADVGIDGGGQARVHSLHGQESFRIRPLALANAWLELPESAEGFDSGVLAPVWPLTHCHPFWSQTP